MPRPALVLLLALLALSAARAARERTQPISTIETVATAFTHAPKPGAAAAHRTKKASRCYRCPCTYVNAPLSCITASEVCHAANGPAVAPQLTSTPPAGPAGFRIHTTALYSHGLVLYLVRAARELHQVLQKDLQRNLVPKLHPSLLPFKPDLQFPVLTGRANRRLG